MSLSQLDLGLDLGLGTGSFMDEIMSALDKKDPKDTSLKDSPGDHPRGDTLDHTDGVDHVDGGDVTPVNDITNPLSDVTNFKDTAPLISDRYIRYILPFE